MQESEETGPKIVVIGGGTGSFTLLKSLKNYTPNLTALVNMSDNGGSTGVLRDELGVLPPGDIRQCLVALSQAPEELRELFNFRFNKGTFQGHSFGNLFLSAVEKMSNDFNEAVRMASDVLRITGKVLPITLDDHQLVLHKDGQDIVGEYKVAHTDMRPVADNGDQPVRPQLSLEPHAKINPLARQAIMDADIVVIAPGNLYGSIAPALLADGVGQALQQTKAPLAFVCNLVNWAKLTPDYTVSDYVAEIERFAGTGTVDFVLYNTDLPDDELLERYAVEGEYPVMVDAEVLEAAPYESIPGNFLSHAAHGQPAGDTLIRRSLIRHDGDTIAKALLSIVRG